MDNTPISKAIFTKKSLTQKTMKRTQLQNVIIRTSIAVLLLIIAILAVAIIAKQLKPSTSATLQSLYNKQIELTEQLKDLKQQRSTLVSSLNDVENKLQSTRVDARSTDNLIKEEVNKDLPELHKTSERILPVQDEVVAATTTEEVKK